MLSHDWPAGSVRWATKQLERKLRQETETAVPQRSPLHSPSTERLPLCSPSSEQPPLRSPLHFTEPSITQGEITAVSKSKDEVRHVGSQRELQQLDSGTDTLPDPSCPSNSNTSQVSGANPISSHTPTGSYMLTPALASSSQLVDSSLDTSAQRQTLHQASSNLMTLDRVTVEESDTDQRLQPSSQLRKACCGSGCDAQVRLARGSQELEKIQQTLRELQAFLHEGVSLEVTDGEVQELPRALRDDMDTEPGPSKEVNSEGTSPRLELGLQLREKQEGKSFLEPTGWHRAMELEARIRQAGLTPPSLMKRSASLAKLDCLELSANDLSDLDLMPHIRSSSSHSQDSFPLSPAHPDDTWKKQKVLAQSALKRVERTSLSGEDSSSPPCLCLFSSPRHCPKEDTGEREEPDGSSGLSSRQQGRGHSTRRSRKLSAEKKQRGVPVLYNTM